MEEYLSKYEKYEKHLIFNVCEGRGGIGDFTKFFMYLLQECINNNIRVYYLGNAEDSIIDSFLKIKDSRMLITLENIDTPTYIYDISLIYNLMPNKNYIVSPTSMYSIPHIFDKIHMQLDHVFCFSDKVKANALTFLNNNTGYISIHLRMGDYYLETDQSYVKCKTDKRQYSEKQLCQFIEKNADRFVVFFCDNATYKRHIKDKYKFIKITDFEIGHTGLENTTYTQILNTVTEFYLMSNSDAIYTASNSGFSVMASKFFNIPIFEI